MSFENSPAEPETTISRRAKLAATVLVAAFLSCVLVVSEVAARTLVTMPMERPVPQVRYEPHPTRLFALRPDQRAFSFGGAVTVGPSGLRLHPAATVDSAALTTVIALGDSFTFGMGVDDSATFPARLEQGLRARSRPSRVLNAGVISYQVNQELDLLRELTRNRRVDAVVHGLYWNDYLVNDPDKQPALRLLREDGLFVWDEPDAAPDSDGFISSLTRRSALLFAARRAGSALRAAVSGVPVGELEYERVERSLESGVIDTAGFARLPEFYADLKRLASERGFALYVVIMPVEGIVRRPAPGSHPYPLYARAMLDSLGIPYLDAHQLWEKRKLGAELFLPYNKHPDAKGYEVIGDAVATWLTERPEWRRP